MVDAPFLLLIPGMAADERLFAPIDLSFGQVHALRWRHIPGVHSLADYAEATIDEVPWPVDGRPVWYIGSSMGGMLAREMHAQRPADELVLLSAPAARTEFPKRMKMLHTLRTGRWFSPAGMMRVNRLSDTFMGFREAQDRAWFYENLEAYGAAFLQFAVNAILDWPRRNRPEAYLQVVGDRDQLFRPHRMMSPVVVPGAGHFLTYEQPGRLSAVLAQRWQQFQERHQD